MKDLGRVRGSYEASRPIWETDDCVYINTNVEKIETEDGHEEYEFDCVRYTQKEYQEMRLENIELAIAELTGGSV